MKIIIVGTSFAAVPAIIYLANLGIKPTVIDVGNEADSDQKYKLKKQTFIKSNDYDNFLCFGGFSNVWTGVIDKYDNSDLIDWPITREILDLYYKKLSKLIYDSEIYSFKCDDNNPLNYSIKKTEDKSENELINHQNFTIKNTSILTNKVFDKPNYNNLNPLNFKIYLEKLIKESKIEYIKGKVEKINEIDNKIKVTTRILGNLKTISCDYLFLGCGSPSTLKLIQNSQNYFEKSLTLKNNKKIVYPILFNHKNKIENPIENFNNIYPIFQINYYSRELGKIYSQISNFNITLLKFLIPKIENSKNIYKFLNIFRRIGFAYTSLDSKYGDKFNFDKNGKAVIYKTKINKHILKKNLSGLFKDNLIKKYFSYINFPIFRNELSGNHFGSSFPMKKDKSDFFDSDTYGRTCNYNKISILDSSIFTTLPAKPPTYTIMANSLRIVENVEKENFFK